MLYNEFKEKVCETVKVMLGSNVRICVQDITKMNDVHLDGMTILSSDCNIAPTIYLNDYFKQYENGRSFMDICKDIVEVYEDNKPTGKVNVSFFTEWEKVNSKIVFKLINYEKNKKLLESTPHMIFLDMAIVFVCLVETNETGSATILIKDHHMCFWNKTVEDLYMVANENTPRLLGCEIKSMESMLDVLFMRNPDPSFEEAIMPSSEGGEMYVMTNKLKLNGSACMLYEDVLKNFAQKTGMNFYILPSSIHEILLIPTLRWDKEMYDELTEMVNEVNSSELNKEEILSDHAYYYSAEFNRIFGNEIA